MNPKLKTALIHIGLFVVTIATTTLAGLSLVGVPLIGWMPWTAAASWQLNGAFMYSGAFLLILTVHEFGHYFTAIYYRIRTSLPYFIPLPPGFFLGTMGAVIRIKEIIRSRQEHFDIGIAGPIAGFVAAIGILVYAFTHLPPPEYIFQIHPTYAQFGLDYAKHVYEPGFSKDTDIIIGKNLIFMFFEKFVADPARIPNPHEMIHYPVLFAGFMSLVFTSINLLPIGQLDGGHVLYGLLGHEKHRKVASVVFVAFVFYSGLGFVTTGNFNEWYWKVPVTIGLTFYCLSGLRIQRQQAVIFALVIFIVQLLMSAYIPGVQGYTGWAVFLLVIRRVVGIEHPEAFVDEPLSRGRILLGWFALLIFILCFAPAPIDIIDPITAQ